MTRGLSFISSDNGCPMPPAPPSTVTFDAYRVMSVIMHAQGAQARAIGSFHAGGLPYLFGRSGEGSPLDGAENLS